MRLLLSLIVLGLGVAHADTTKFDAQMAPMLDDYLAVQKALAADGLDGVAEKAKALQAAAAKLDASKVTGEHAAHYANVPAKLQEATKALVEANDLAATREAFKAVSRPLVMWASMSKPAGVSVIYCSMAKGSWLQKDTAVKNPYYGKSMLTCGEIIEGAGKGTASGHMKKN